MLPDVRPLRLIAPGMDTSVLVWHYTTGSRESAISDSGCLLAAVDGVRDHESPITWFSARQEFEPTARTMMVRTEGRPPVRLSRFETAKFGSGLVRYGLPRASAIPWLKLCGVARIRLADQKRLERAGRNLGADPLEWFGVLGPVSLEAIVAIEYSDGIAAWHAAGIS